MTSGQVRGTGFFSARPVTIERALHLAEIADPTIRKAFRNQIFYYDDNVNSSSRSRCVYFYVGINPLVKSRDAWRGIDLPRNKYNRSSGILLCNASVGRASPVNVTYNKLSARA